VSEADLIYKDPSAVDAVTTHKVEHKNIKPVIKPFKIDRNHLTGLRNFTDICKDPLALPVYALPESNPASGATQS